jgi:hypothetical protein
LTQLAYIDHANFPGGLYGYERSYNSTTKSYFTLSGVLDLTIEVLTVGIQVGHQLNLSTSLNPPPL